MSVTKRQLQCARLKFPDSPKIQDENGVEHLIWLVSGQDVWICGHDCGGYIRCLGIQVQTEKRNIYPDLSFSGGE